MRTLLGLGVVRGTNCNCQELATLSPSQRRDFTQKYLVVTHPYGSNVVKFQLSNMRLLSKESNTDISLT